MFADKSHGLSCLAPLAFPSAASHASSQLAGTCMADDPISYSESSTWA